MRSGHLASIRWVPLKRPLTARAARSPQAQALAVTGIPRPPFGMPIWQEARFFLHAAAEVEHSLLVQYLYAFFSLSDTAPATDWARELRDVAIQEMCHLITIQNLLLAVGADPYLDRQDPLAFSIPFILEPFSPQALAKYVTTEAPSPDKVPEGERELVRRIEAMANLRAWVGAVGSAAGGLGDALGGVLAAPNLTVKYVGALYALLYWLFLPTDRVEGPWPASDFPGDILATELSGRHLQPNELSGLADRRQAEEPAWGGTPNGPRIVRPVRDPSPMADMGALQPIYLIAAQGEGWEDGHRSHFNRFLALWAPLEQAVQQGVAFARNVPVNPSVDPTRPGTRTITNRVAALWAKLLNARYQMLLMKLYLALARPTDQPGGGPAGRASLIDRAIWLEMSVGIAAIASRLVGLPLKPRPAGGGRVAEMAAPPFELPDAPLPDRPALQCQRLIELIDQAADHVRALQAVPPDEPDRPTADDVNDILRPLTEDDAALRPALEKLKPTLP